MFLKGYQPLVPIYFTFIITQDKFVYYLPQQDTVYEGNIDALSKASDLTLILSPHLLQNALLPVYFSSAMQAIQAGNDSVLTDEVSNTVIRHITFQHDIHAITQLELSDKLNASKTTITFSDFMHKNAAPYPKHIVIAQPHLHTEITFSFDEFAFNSHIPDDIFDIHVPQDTKRRDITQE